MYNYINVNNIILKLIFISYLIHVYYTLVNDVGALKH